MQISPLLPAAVAETASVMAQVFSAAEPMTRALGLSADVYRTLTSLVCEDAAASGLGTIARDGAGRVVAFSISERWPPKPYEPLPDELGMRPGLELLLALEREFDRVHAADRAALHVFFIGCVPEFRRRGITRRVVQANLEQGRRAGLTRAFTEATNDGSAALFASLGFTTLAEVDYATFEWAGARPFAGIARGEFGPAVKSCRLMTSG